MKKIWKGKNEKSQKHETVGAVTHTHTHTHKHVIKDNVGADALKSAHEKKKNIMIRTRVIVPLIVVLVLISIIAVICVGAPFGRPQETAELNKNIDTNKEKISAATDIAATSIGTNVKATFTVSTGEIKITPGGSNSDSIINKTNWNNFLKKIVDADGSLDAVKTINFTNSTYAPANSSNLFSPIISNTNYPFSQVVTFDEEKCLWLNKVTNATSMFEGMSKVKEFKTSYYVEKLTNMTRMFYGCSSLEKTPKFLRASSVTVTTEAFMNCTSLKTAELNSERLYGEWMKVTNLDKMFAGCSSLSSFVPPAGLTGHNSRNSS